MTTFWRFETCNILLKENTNRERTPQIVFEVATPLVDLSHHNAMFPTGLQNIIKMAWIYEIPLWENHGIYLALAPRM